MAHERTVLITGCTKGSIGYALAQEFARRDYHVYATARKLENMDDLASTYPGHITPLALDVTSPDSIQAVYTRISHETDGTLDILYHNAGYRSLAMASETSYEESVKMFNTNVFGVIELTRLCSSMVVKAKGKIVFTGSVSAYTPHPSQSVYCASKAALELYVRTLRIEMQPFKVQVVLVNTGGIDTGMTSSRVDLAEESRYAHLSQIINQAWDDLEGSTMTPHDYARYVVKRVDGLHAPSTIWYGTGASIVWWIKWLNISWLYSWYFARVFGLNK